MANQNLDGDDLTGLSVFCRSLAIVGIAELFDKTWFMGLLLALRYKKVTVFAGSVSALILHTILAAALGYAFAEVLSPTLLSFMAAGLFVIFTLLYAKDWYFADPDRDAIAAGREEAEGDCELLPASKDGIGANECEVEQVGKEEGDSRTMVNSHSEWFVLSKSFMAVFIAEWGDRTQIAMVGQHASQPLIPVFLGSVVAFALLTLSAVGAASVLSGLKLTEKFIYGVSALCFAAFAVLAFKDGFDALNSGATTQ